MNAQPTFRDMTPEQRKEAAKRAIESLPEKGEPSSVLDCPNETGTWLAENFADVVQTGALEIIGDWLAGPRDGYAEAKAHRELMELAKKCDKAIHDVLNGGGA